MIRRDGHGGREFFNPLPAPKPSQEGADLSDAARCQNLFKAVIVQAMRDGGLVRWASPTDGSEGANQFAHNQSVSWLYATSGSLKSDRATVCLLAGIEPEYLDRMLAKRARPRLIADYSETRRVAAWKAKLPEPEPKYELTVDDIRAALLQRGINPDEMESDPSPLQASSDSGSSPVGGLPASEETTDED